jgi:hypothetical protein
MPHSGGYIVWVHNAFGPALALLNGMVNRGAALNRGALKRAREGVERASEALA